MLQWTIQPKNNTHSTADGTQNVEKEKGKMNIFCLVCWKKEFLKARGKKSHFLSITLACLETRLNTRERTMSHMKNLFSRIGAKIWSSVPDSDRALKFKNTGYRVGY